MTNVWCVRAEYGKYTDAFVTGGYIGLGWIPDVDLSHIKDRSELYPIYQKTYPQDTSNVVIGQQVGQIARFLLDIGEGDYVITPTVDTSTLRYGKVASAPYYVESVPDGCPYRHRRTVEWVDIPLHRAGFSMPFRYTLGAAMTVFAISHREEFLDAIGSSEASQSAVIPQYNSHGMVLEQLLQLDSKEFEILVSHLLAALGFQGPEVTGQSGDGGVDVTGELDVSNLATIRLFVQVKRYSLGTKVGANIVRQLRQSIPHGGQGAFITTAEYQSAASDVAYDPNFPRIGLINGHQLVDLLIEHWGAIPPEFREKLRLKPGLVLA